MYPYGSSMTVQAPALPILSSGAISYPLNRPIAGVWERGPHSAQTRPEVGNVFDNFLDTHVCIDTCTCTYGVTHATRSCIETLQCA